MNVNKPYSRSERVEKQILDIMCSIMTKSIDLSYLGFVTFTKADISPDLKNAKIFYSVINQKFSDSEINIQINKKQKAFKKYLSPELNLRNVPKIHFYLDQAFTYTEKIDRLLEDSDSKVENCDIKPS